MVAETDQQTPSLDITNAHFISTLPEPLRGFALQALNPPPDGEVGIADNDKSGSHKLDQLEISTRSHLLELVERLLAGQEQQEQQAPSAPAIETLLKYLKNATLLCLHVSHHSSKKNNNNPLYSHILSTACIKKLPFILLEDAIDSLPLIHIQSLWASPQFPTQCISSYTTTLLCSPLIFVTPSKFVLLRICNKLLKVVSNRDVDAEFAGSVMMMMAKVFPLSERSAVNVLGSFNVKNETLLEDEKEFASKATNGRGKKHSNSIGYDFYKTFWGVQKVFTNPQGTILPSRGAGPSQAAAATAYTGFIKDVTSILVALESTPISKSSNTTAGMLQPEDTSTANVVRHHKYLTSSQLLHLQLKDAKLRVHFLTQLIIILSYLDSPTVTLPTPPITSTPGSDTAKLSAQIISTQMKQLANVKKRTMELLRATDMGVAASTAATGECLLRSIQWLLRERESIWRSWKRSKCLPAMDKVGQSSISGMDIKNKLSGKKRKAEDSDSIDGGKEDTGGIPKIATLLKTSLPTLTSFLDPYVEALDPENGIEGEYHPRNDNVYSWRALRLMARDQVEEGQLRRFGKLRKRDGDFEGIVRDMWKEDNGGQEIGGEMPETYDEVVEETLVNREISIKDSNVLEMDAASVGTPEEELEAKKEKMAEFEKAAMEVEEEMLNDETVEDSPATKVGAAENRAGVKKGESEEKNMLKEKEEKKEKVNSCPIYVAAAETIDSMFSEEPKKRIAIVPKKVDSIEPKKFEPTVMRKEPEFSNDRLVATGALLTKRNEKSKENATRKRGKKDDKKAVADPKAKAPKGATVKLVAPTVDSSDKQEDHKPSRAKFTPPTQKLLAQLQGTKGGDVMDRFRGGRFGARTRYNDSTNNINERPLSHQQHSQQKQPLPDRNSNADGHSSGIRSMSRAPPPPPPLKPVQSQRDTRPSAHYAGAGAGTSAGASASASTGGPKNKDNGRDSGKWDGGKLGATGGSNEDNAPSGKANTGKGNSNNDRGGNMNAAPQGGIDGPGRGGWEPPQGGGGGGRGRGGGRAAGRGRGGYRRSFTKRR